MGVVAAQRFDQLSCIHSKCTGSMDFSWAWNQLHGTSAKTISRKPFCQLNGSHTGSFAAGSGPMWVHNRPAHSRTG
jgi:hypothetical protein